MNIQINISLDSKNNINNQNPDQVTFNLDASAIAKNMESKSDLPYKNNSPTLTISSMVCSMKTSKEKKDKDGLMKRLVTFLQWKN